MDVHSVVGVAEAFHAVGESEQSDAIFERALSLAATDGSIWLGVEDTQAFVRHFARKGQLGDRLADLAAVVSGKTHDWEKAQQLAAGASAATDCGEVAASHTLLRRALKSGTRGGRIAFFEILERFARRLAMLGVPDVEWQAVRDVRGGRWLVAAASRRHGRAATARRVAALTSMAARGRALAAIACFPGARREVVSGFHQSRPELPGYYLTRITVTEVFIPVTVIIMKKAPVPLTPAVFHILLALADGPLHGYGIMQAVEAAAGGEPPMGPGTIYGSLQRMEEAGLVKELPARTDDRRRVFTLLPAGRRALVQEAERLSRLAALVRAKKLLFRTRRDRERAGRPACSACSCAPIRASSASDSAPTSRPTFRAAGHARPPRGVGLRAARICAAPCR